MEDKCEEDDGSGCRSRDLANYCRLLCGSSARRDLDPEDLFQETWLRVYEASGHAPRSRSWILGVARNVFLEMLRRSLRKSIRGFQMPEASEYELKDHGTSLTGLVARGETRRQVRQFLDTLLDKDRRLLLEHHCEEVPLKEVALHLRISEAAASKRCQRLLARCRELRCFEGWQ